MSRRRTFVGLGTTHAPSPDVRCGLSPPLTRRLRRSAILAPLANDAGSRGTGSPSLGMYEAPSET